MSPVTGKKVIEYLGDSASVNGGMIIVDFINGEPLLNFEAMKYIVEYANQYEKIKGEKIFIFRCTTNGSLLTEDILDFAIENGIQLNLSVDGIPESHDTNRTYPGGLLTSPDVHKKIHWLSDLDNVSVISTYTPETCKYMYESTKYFMDYGIRSIGIGFAQGQTNYSHRDRDRCLQEFSKSMDLFLNRYKNYDFYFSYVELDHYLRSLFSRTPPATTCSYPFRITVCGDIMNCDRIPRNLDMKVGSIFDTIPHKAKHLCEDTEIQRCKECSYRNMCRQCNVYVDDIFQRGERAEEPFFCAMNKVIIDKARSFFMNCKNDPQINNHFDQSKTIIIRRWRYRVANAVNDSGIESSYDKINMDSRQMIHQYNRSEMSTVKATCLLVINAKNAAEINSMD